MIRQYEQQIEAYKLSENEAKEIIAELKHKNKGLKKELKILQQQIRLENQQYNDLVHDSVGDLGLIRKYKQALEEIREISQPIKEDMCNSCGLQDENCCDSKKCTCNEFIIILHKINEVLNEK